MPYALTLHVLLHTKTFFRQNANSQLNVLLKRGIVVVVLKSCNCTKPKDRACVHRTKIMRFVEDST